MARLAMMAVAAAGLWLSAGAEAQAAANMDRCVYFGWSKRSDAPRVFEYAIRNYCKRRVYVQVCVSGTRLCRGHYLSRTARNISRTIQDSSRRGQRMTYRAIAN